MFESSGPISALQETSNTHTLYADSSGGERERERQVHTLSSLIINEGVRSDTSTEQDVAQNQQPDVNYKEKTQSG